MTSENLLPQPSSYKNLLIGYGFIWNIVPTSTPKIMRKCRRCEQDRFYSSNKFRVNANKKLIDVWLIYKCIYCDATLNLPIINRTPITKIEKELCNRFQRNDTALCWQYAFDSGLFQKGMKMDWDIDIVVQEQILDNPIAFETLYKMRVLIKSQYYLKIPIFSVLRAKMQLSRAQLEKLQSNQALEVFNFNNDPIVLKNFLGNGCVLVVKN